MSHFIIPRITLWFNYIPTTVNPYMLWRLWERYPPRPTNKNYTWPSFAGILKSFRYQHNAPKLIHIWEDWLQPGDLKWPVVFFWHSQLEVTTGNVLKVTFTLKRSIYELSIDFLDVWHHLKVQYLLATSRNSRCRQSYARWWTSCKGAQIQLKWW